MFTYQDFEKVRENEIEKRDFIEKAILGHQQTKECQMSIKAKEYYEQKTDILKYQKYVTKATGEKVPDLWSANNKIPSNWYFFFTTQAIQFLLGNGVQFKNADTIKKLGKNFIGTLKKICLYAKNGSVGYGMWDNDRLFAFRYDEFVPLKDERTAQLRAGIRFWKIDETKPMQITLYEDDGFTVYEKKDSQDLKVVQEKRGYKVKTKSTKADGIIYAEYENYSSLPIFELHNINNKSDLAGTKPLIDAYDLLTSGLVNNVSQGELLYWVFKNCGGYRDDENALQDKIQQILTTHAVNINEDAEATPHTVETPYQANDVTLKNLENQLYKTFMGLRVEDIASGNITATQIEASYEPLTEKTDMFESCVTEFLTDLLEFLGINDEPSYVRSMISNKTESIQNVLSAGEYLDDEFIVNRLCTLFGVSQAEAEEILRRKDADELDRFKTDEPMEEEPKGEE